MKKLTMKKYTKVDFAAFALRLQAKGLLTKKTAKLICRFCNKAGFDSPAFLKLIARAGA